MMVGKTAYRAQKITALDVWCRIELFEEIMRSEREG